MEQLYWSIPLGSGQGKAFQKLGSKADDNFTNASGQWDTVCNKVKLVAHMITTLVQWCGG